MAWDATTKRRLFGGVVLGLALLMLIVGETVLSGRLSALQFLGYWLVCLLLTAAAVFTAFLDLRHVARTARERQKNMLNEALKEIQRKADERRNPPPPAQDQ